MVYYSFFSVFLSYQTNIFCFPSHWNNCARRRKRLKILWHSSFKHIIAWYLTWHKDAPLQYWTLRITRPAFSSPAVHNKTRWRWSLISLVAPSARAYRVYHCIKWLGVLLLRLDGMLVHCLLPLSISSGFPELASKLTKQTWLTRRFKQVYNWLKNVIKVYNICW